MDVLVYLFIFFFGKELNLGCIIGFQDVEYLQSFSEFIQALIHNCQCLRPPPCINTCYKMRRAILAIVRNPVPVEPKIH